MAHRNGFRGGAAGERRYGGRIVAAGDRSQRRGSGHRPSEARRGWRVLMSTSARPLWIDWGRHMRTHSMVRQLGADLVEVRPGGGRLVRYARSLAQTFRAIRDRRPEIVIATNPSIV